MSSLPPLAMSMLADMDRWRRCPLYFAVEKVTLRAVRIILALDPTMPMKVDSFQRTVIIDCVSMERLTSCAYQLVLPLLLRACPAAASIADWKRELPMHIAVWIRVGGTLEALYGAFPKALEERNLRGNTPIHVAAVQGSPVAVKFLLIVTNEAMSVLNSRGLTPIAMSTRYHHADALEIMLEHSPSSVVTFCKGNTPLHVAARYPYHPDITDLLLRYADSSAMLLRNHAEETVHVAVRRGRTVILAAMLRKNAEAVKQRLNNGDTVFHIAARAGHVGMLQALTAHWPEGAVTCNQEGKTPADVACNGAVLKFFFTADGRIVRNGGWNRAMVLEFLQWCFPTPSSQTAAAPKARRTLSTKLGRLPWTPLVNMLRTLNVANAERICARPPMVGERYGVVFALSGKLLSWLHWHLVNDYDTVPDDNYGESAW